MNTFELKELSLNEVYYLQFPTSPGIAGQKTAKTLLKECIESNLPPYVDKSFLWTMSTALF